MMAPQELENLATAWAAYWHVKDDMEKHEAHEWATDAAWDLMRKSPEDAWRLILAVLRIDDSDTVQEVLSAGPLEDLLAEHGELAITWVEEEARRNPAFASLLGGVWQNAMSNEIWARVQAVWDRRGWDGNPE
jgi:hypothetical protein